ncbi:hypothetical protein TGDOM2_306860 [Toxoplasma gondii GAB2-2007-GAL-DOM2]|uniref:Uncharacterized protein n=1 Tax=Toxoplasma gondii GAB2-2007-GAL-DOM2 TaxID=1130820 RepID=A0A086JBR5_TOXGO|nr:hypothetical protein TGDOM2_306860 [Toxoplasma gondii GAB2-2007-GAL-DOM2]
MTVVMQGRSSVVRTPVAPRGWTVSVESVAACCTCSGLCRDALGRGMWGDGTRDGGRTDVRATDAWRKEGTKRQETLSVSWKHGRARMCVRKVAFYRTNGAAVGRDKLLHKATSAQRTAAVRGTVQLSHAW